MPPERRGSLDIAIVDRWKRLEGGACLIALIYSGKSTGRFTLSPDASRREIWLVPAPSPYALTTDINSERSALPINANSLELCFASRCRRARSKAAVLTIEELTGQENKRFRRAVSDLA